MVTVAAPHGLGPKMRESEYLPASSTSPTLQKPNLEERTHDLFFYIDHELNQACREIRCFK